MNSYHRIQADYDLPNKVLAGIRTEDATKHKMEERMRLAQD